MSTDEYVPRAATWDEIETGFHEYAADLTKEELGHDGPGGTSFPPEFADWTVGMKAAREWLAAHDARVRRDAARDALDDLEADTAQVIRTMRERGEQGWARYAIANDILDNHRTRFYPEEAR